MSQSDAGGIGVGQLGFLRSTTMDDIACSLSGIAAIAVLAFAVYEWLGPSISASAGYRVLVFALIGIQGASAGFALGVACLLRSISSLKAWVGVSLGAGVLLAEVAFLFSISNNF